MKKWESPQLQDLSVANTSDDGKCPFEEQAKAEAPGGGDVSPMTLFPIYVWGDGKIGCTYWNCEKHGCEHPCYGNPCMFWPCPPVGGCPDASK